MAKNRGQVVNTKLKPFKKGEYPGGPGRKKGVFQFNSALYRALEYKTPEKLRAKIKKDTGRDAITWEEAVLAVLVAKAATGSARHIDILFKLKGDYARAEAQARREVEHENPDGEIGSTLLIKVVRKSDVTPPVTPIRTEIDVTPESGENAS